MIKPRLPFFIVLGLLWGIALLPTLFGQSFYFLQAPLFTQAEPGSSVTEYFLTTYLLILGGVFVIVMLDALRAIRIPTTFFTVERTVQTSISIDYWYDVQLKISYSGSRTVHCQIFDHPPSHAQFRNLPLPPTSLPPNGWEKHIYSFTSNRRGTHTFEWTEIFVQSPWRLWEARKKVKQVNIVRIYPDFGRLGKEAIQATMSENITGTLKRKKVGQGMDFAELKEYQQGDQLRQIDWAASSRHQKLISRHYQEEKDQHIILMMDCGRRMGTVEFHDDQRLSHFDRSLNAGLILSYIALQQGDAVGLLTFGTGKAPTFIPPKRGKSSLSHLLNATFEIEPSLMVSDYEQAAMALLKHTSKRALVLLFTNLRNEDDAAIAKACHLLRKHHLVILVNLRELALEQVLTISHLATEEDAASFHLSQQYDLERKEMIRKLEQNRIMTLDIEPAKVTNAVINRYLSIKAAGQL